MKVLYAGSIPFSASVFSSFRDAKARVESASVKVGVSTMGRAEGKD